MFPGKSTYRTLKRELQTSQGIEIETLPMFRFEVTSWNTCPLGQQKHLGESYPRAEVLESGTRKRLPTSKVTRTHNNSNLMAECSL